MCTVLMKNECSKQQRSFCVIMTNIRCTWNKRFYTFFFEREGEVEYCFGYKVIILYILMSNNVTTNRLGTYLVLIIIIEIIL